MQTYKICSADLNHFPKTNKLSGDRDYEHQASTSNIRKEDNGRWFNQDWRPSGFIKEHIPSITTISQMTKHNYEGPKNVYTGTENWNYHFYPATAKWVTDFRPLLENKSIGTAPLNLMPNDMDKGEKEGLQQNRGTATSTSLNGAKKQTRDAANFVAPCPKHIHRLVLPPFFKPSGYLEDSQLKWNEVKGAFITKGEHFTTSTQANFVVGNSQAIYNQNIKENSKPKNVIPFEKSCTKSIASISSWDYFDDRLPEKKPYEKKRVPQLLDKQMSTPVIKHRLFKNVDRLAVESKDNDSRAYNKKCIFQVSPMDYISMYKHSDKKNNECRHSQKTEMPIPTRRNSSGTLNYNEDDSQGTVTSNSVRSSPGVSQKEMLKRSDSDLDKFKGKHHERTTYTDSIPALFKESVPKCSLHDEINCQNVVCRKKSSYLFRRHHYYEAIMDQVHYIKKKIKSLNFTLRDLEHLFSLIEKANEDLIHEPNDSNDKFSTKRNKLKWEGFRKKVKSSKDETKFTLDTIKQLENLFDTVLMNIELSENKLETTREQ